MCSNDSPSQKRDGTAEPDVSTDISRQRLQSDYGASIDSLRDTRLPETRIEELVTLCVETQQRLDHGRGDGEQTLTLVAAVGEAMADLEAATVVDESELPESRALETGVPAEEYVLTPTERDEALAALSSLLHTAVETPPASPATTAGAAD
ncbi:hypothetical protein [Halobaculum sp. MBLA0143]|uniref:hypothetical protein n=1 Tax=Halobaculum sp. MBLA0143 TaxID=3079933 RepID=UPI0035238BBD